MRGPADTVDGSSDMVKLIIIKKNKLIMLCFHCAILRRNNILTKKRFITWVKKSLDPDQLPSLKAS